MRIAFLHTLISIGTFIHLLKCIYFSMDDFFLYMYLSDADPNKESQYHPAPPAYNRPAPPAYISEPTQVRLKTKGSDTIVGAFI